MSSYIGLVVISPLRWSFNQCLIFNHISTAVFLNSCPVYWYPKYHKIFTKSPCFCRGLGQVVNNHHFGLGMYRRSLYTFFPKKNWTWVKAFLNFMTRGIVRHSPYDRLFYIWLLNAVMNWWSIVLIAEFIYNTIITLHWDILQVSVL